MYGGCQRISRLTNPHTLNLPNCFPLIMSYVLTGDNIQAYRAKVLLGALKLEIKGLKISRGPSAYSIIKREYNLKGSRVSVLNQLEFILGS